MERKDTGSDTASILAALYRRESAQIKLNLEPIQRLLLMLGNPHRNLRCIHVAGTNGKGSVTAMLGQILIEAGYRVGMYTSPHLKRFNERIKINNIEITNRDIAGYYKKIEPHITNQSFFEITTALAFLYFYEQKVDFAVIETGLGGRLDATNVITPLVSIITTIDYDHTNLLGKTLSAIAREKAGIIKPNIPVLTQTQGEPLRVIQKIAAQKKAAVFYASPLKKKVSLKFLHGDFQQKNAAIAAGACRILQKQYGIVLTQKIIRSGLANTRWDGRMEFKNKYLIIDGAHNPAGIRVLTHELKKIGQKTNAKFIFVIGILRDKKYADMVRMILPLAQTIIITKPSNERALAPEILQTEIKKIKNIPCKIIQKPRPALRYAQKIRGKNEIIVVTGSLYLVGELRSINYAK